MTPRSTFSPETRMPFHRIDGHTGRIFKRAWPEFFFVMIPRFFYQMWWPRTGKPLRWVKRPASERIMVIFRSLPRFISGYFTMPRELRDWSKAP